MLDILLYVFLVTSSVCFISFIVKHMFDIKYICSLMGLQKEYYGSEDGNTIETSEDNEKNVNDKYNIDGFRERIKNLKMNADGTFNYTLEEINEMESGTEIITPSFEKQYEDKYRI